MCAARHMSTGLWSTAAQNATKQRMSELQYNELTYNTYKNWATKSQLFPQPLKHVTTHIFPSVQEFSSCNPHSYMSGYRKGAWGMSGCCKGRLSLLLGVLPTLGRFAVWKLTEPCTCDPCTHFKKAIFWGRIYSLHQIFNLQMNNHLPSEMLSLVPVLQLKDSNVGGYRINDFSLIGKGSIFL